MNSFGQKRDLLSPSIHLRLLCVSMATMATQGRLVCSIVAGGRVVRNIVAGAGSSVPQSRV
jgi:hypothetical protein